MNGVHIFTDPAYLHYNPAVDKIFNLIYLQKYNCIISKTGDPGVFANRSVLQYVNNFLIKKSDYKLSSFSAPDNSSILLFIKK